MKIPLLHPHYPVLYRTSAVRSAIAATLLLGTFVSLRLHADTAVDTRRIAILQETYNKPIGAQDPAYPAPNLSLPSPLTGLHLHYEIRALTYLAMADQGIVSESVAVDTANRLLRYAIHRWPASGPGAVVGQYASAWDHRTRTLAVRSYYLYRDYFDADIRAEFEQRMAYAVTTHTNSSSENIRFSTNSLIFLAHENQNQTGAASWTGVRNWIIDNLRQRGEDGYHEIASYYQHWTISAILNLAEFAQDSTVRNLAIAVLDRTLGGLAPFAMEGRIYQPGIRNKPGEIEAAAMPQTDILELFYYRTPTKSQYVEWAASNYNPPVVVGTMQAHSRKLGTVNPETMSRSNVDPNSYPLYSYSLNRIGIATHQALANGHYAGTHDVGACKIYSNHGRYSHAATFGIPRGADNESTNPDSFHPQPNWLSVNDRSFGYKGVAIVNGGGKCQRVFYSNQWAYNIPVRLFYGADYHGSVIFDSGWAFLSNGNSYIAWAPLVGNPAHDPDTASIQLTSFGRYLVSSHSPADTIGEYSIVEIGDLEEYGSFANFRTSIKNRNGHPHTLLNAGEVTYTARDNTVIKVGVNYAKLNGTNVVPANYPRFSSTMSNGTAISGNTFTVNGTPYTFNWTNGTVSPAFARVAVDRTFGNVTSPPPPSGLIYEDTFTGVTAGANLHGTAPEIGGSAWSANANVKFGSSDDVTAVAATSGIGGLAFNPNAYAGGPISRVRAHINPAGSAWVGLGFSSSAQGGYWTDARVWALIRPGGTYELWANGTGTSLGTGNVPNFVWGGENLVEVDYRPASNQAVVRMNGVQILAPTTLPTGSSITHAGFHILQATQNTTTLDDFEVEVLQQAPFESPQQIPGIIQVEKYDIGGEGFAYHDTTIGNTGGGYRADDVDLVGNSGDVDSTPSLGWADHGEWLEYTVDVNCNATYQVDVRVATPVSGTTLHLELNGQAITGQLTVPNTGGWGNWQTMSFQYVHLSAGNGQTLRLVIDNAAMNINWIEFKPLQSAPIVDAPSPSSQNVSIGEDIEFSASATEQCPYTYQWQFNSGGGFVSLANGGRISGATGPVLHIDNVQASDEGDYRCQVSNLYGTGTSTAASLTVGNIQEPFNVSPFTISTSQTSRVEAEEYDLGGQNLAYFDSTAGNSGNSAYRSVEAEDVDIYDYTDGGPARAIGFLANGEWTEYTAAIQGGTYTVSLRLASGVSNSTFHLEVDGVPVTTTQTVPNTGGWSNWTTIAIPNVQLPDSGSGTGVIRVAYDTGAWNFNWMEFAPAAAPSQLTPNDDSHTYKNAANSTHDDDGLDTGYFGWGGFGSNAERRAYIEVTFGSTPLSEARLWLYWQQVDTAYNGTIKAAEYNFNESTLTWNNQPNTTTWTTVVSSLNGTTSAGWHSWNITSFYNNNLGKTITFVVTGTAEFKDGYFEDREGSRTGNPANGPYIELAP